MRELDPATAWITQPLRQLQVPRHEVYKARTFPTYLWPPWPPRRELSDALEALWDYAIAVHEATAEATKRLGECMSAVDDALAQLDEATTAVANRLEGLAEQVASMDADTAAKITAEADKLRGLAADPENPVPVEPGAVESGSADGDSDSAEFPTGAA